MVAARADDVVPAIVAELRWHCRTASSPVSKGSGNQHAVCARVGVYIDEIWATVWQCMMGIQLLPVEPLAFAVVNVVAERLLLTATQVRLLLKETVVGPVLVEG